MNCRQIRPIVLALALTLPLAAADPELIRLTRPDANFLLGARLSDIAASPLVKTLLDEALDSKPEWGVGPGLAGTNPLEGFDEVLISANHRSRNRRRSPKTPWCCCAARWIWRGSKKRSAARAATANSTAAWR